MVIGSLGKDCKGVFLWLLHYNSKNLRFLLTDLANPIDCVVLSEYNQCDGTLNWHESDYDGNQL